MKPGKNILAVWFLAVAALLVASMGFDYAVGQRVIRAEQEMTARLSRLNQLTDFLSELKDTETGQRGFLLTGDAAYLQPYRDGLKRAQQSAADLHQAAATNDLPRENVERTLALTRQRLAELEQTIQLCQSGDTNAALDIVRQNRGKQTMDDLRKEVGLMQNQEQGAYADAFHRARHMAELRAEMFLGMAVVNLVFLGWVARKMFTALREREAAVFKTKRQEELLDTTLASIGDAVIVTNAAGRVTFLNGEAEHLTGWKSAEAHERALPEVFKIVNEDTRETVENPVEKALRLGAVVGLANHTLLLARDGRETPIDDSAAPIRHPGGPVFGVVLVFRNFTEQREAQRVLQRSKAELEGLVAERTARLQEMIAELQHISYAMVHDMRAPLRAMDAFVELMDDSQVTPEQRHEYGRRIRTAANRLDHLIQHSLRYTKFAQEDITLEPVNLSTLVRGIIETYPDLQADKADVRIEGELPVVIGSEALLTHCFGNLLGNAVKFVAPGVRPQVRVQPEVKDGMARIWIRDNGIGIPQHAHRRLFKMFQRLNEDYEGTGIGLAIVRKVAERMNGNVGVESDAGRGSNFWVELPMASPAAGKEVQP